jgi:hypothetical protein
LRRIAIYEFDPYVACSQNLGEEFTQADFLAYFAAVSTDAIGGPTRPSTLWALP